MVFIPVIPATWEVEIGRILDQVSEIINSKNQPRMVLLICNLSYTEGVGRKIKI
jgi:hypothetical protein